MILTSERVNRIEVQIQFATVSGYARVRSLEELAPRCMSGTRAESGIPLDRAAQVCFETSRSLQPVQQVHSYVRLDGGY